MLNVNVIIKFNVSHMLVVRSLSVLSGGSARLVRSGVNSISPASINTDDQVRVLARILMGPIHLHNHLSIHFRVRNHHIRLIIMIRMVLLLLLLLLLLMLLLLLLPILIASVCIFIFTAAKYVLVSFAVLCC